MHYNTWCTPSICLLEIEIQDHWGIGKRLFVRKLNHTRAHKYTFLFVAWKSLFRHGLVDSVVLFTLLYLVVTDILFPVGWCCVVVKKGWFKTSSAEILLTGDNSNILWSKSMQSDEILSPMYSSNFWNRFERISFSDMPVLSFMTELEQFISFSSVSVGTPMKY